MTYETLDFEVTDGVATITLNRPDDANALDSRMLQEIFYAAVRCDDDLDIRAVIVTGSGRFFCAGGDLKDFMAQGDNLPRFLTEKATFLHAGLVRFQRMNAPVIMAVNGVAAGGGMSMMMGGDVVLASDKAKFVMAYTASGLSPDGTSTYFLAKHVGLLRAKELMFLNRTLTAEEALDWGLVSKVVPGDDLMATAQAMAADFAKGPTLAYGAAKRMMLSAFSNPIETQVELETECISNMMRTHDGRHGLESFAAKKTPEFRGE
ncbi:MAG: enoyl-CoA hydratase-related protein [Pseudomonadota bacterium]